MNAWQWEQQLSSTAMIDALVPVLSSCHGILCVVEANSAVAQLNFDMAEASNFEPTKLIPAAMLAKIPFFRVRSRRSPRVSRAVPVGAPPQRRNGCFPLRRSSQASVWNKEWRLTLPAVSGHARQLWCVFELCVAASLRLPIVIKVGFANTMGQFVSLQARDTLQNLFLLVDTQV